MLYKWIHFKSGFSKGAERVPATVIALALNNRNYTFDLIVSFRKAIRKSTCNKYKFYWVHIKYINLSLLKIA